MTKKLASNPNAEYIVRLNCNHHPTFLRGYLPDIDSDIWCYRCQEYRRVCEIVGMYRADCDRCTFARTYGAARLTAQRNADQHARKYPGHVLTVTLGGQEISVHSAYGTQVELPYETGT